MVLNQANGKNVNNNDLHTSFIRFFVHLFIATLLHKDYYPFLLVDGPQGKCK